MLFSQKQKLEEEKLVNNVIFMIVVYLMSNEVKSSLGNGKVSKF